MTTFFIWYMGAWMLACGIGVAIAIRAGRNFRISRRAYWQFLLRPWKVVTFLTAAIGFAVIAPYTGDPTWDYFDALFMSVFTFLSAPWAVGTIFLGIRRRVPPGEIYAALCAWMFSASWSYDLYLVLRDGYYPETWFANIFASSVLYISAGLMWNLEWREQRGVIFGFMREDWPVAGDAQHFSKIMWFAVPFMVLAAAAVVVFLINIH
jgi:hypothetical protein